LGAKLARFADFTPSSRAIGRFGDVSIYRVCDSGTRWVTRNATSSFYRFFPRGFGLQRPSDFVLKPGLAVVVCAWSHVRYFLLHSLNWLSHKSNAQGNFGTTVGQSDREFSRCIYGTIRLITTFVHENFLLLYCVKLAASGELLYTLRSSITNWSAYSAANNIEGWNSSSPVCTWSGITCSDTGQVVSL
jgi:hypothetical protein